MMAVTDYGLPDKDFATLCARVANQVEPRYRHGARSYSCTGHVARLWQAAWDGACIAYGRNPADFRGVRA